MNVSDAPSFYADIDPSAVSIIVDHDPPHRPLGTGFYFLQPHFFVTAKHVVVDESTGVARPNLVLMQSGPDYPKLTVKFLHPTLDVAVLLVDHPACTTPLYPSDQRIAGHQGLRYWGYAPNLSNKQNHRYIVAVVEIPTYESELPRERDDGIEWVIRFKSHAWEQGNSGGPVLGLGGGVVAIITQGYDDWISATEIRALLPFMTMEFPESSISQAQEGALKVRT
jgi:hypothetical protein